MKAQSAEKALAIKHNSDPAEKLKRLAAISGLVGAIAIGGLIGAGEASGGKEKAVSDLTGPQIQLVCAYPSDASSCNTASVEKVGEQIQAFLGDSSHGAVGLSARLALQGGNISVVPLHLDAASSDVLQMAQSSYSNQNGPNNLLAYVEGQEQSKLEVQPQVDYVTFLTNTSGLEQIQTCSPGIRQAGLKIGHQTTLNYLDSLCDPDGTQRAPAINALQAIFINDGYLQPCNKYYSPPVYSSEPNNLLNIYKGNLYQSNLGSWLKSVPSCAGADVDPRMDWQTNLTTNGKGSFQIYQKLGANSAAVNLDPGNRLEAGREYIVKYLPAPGEKNISFSGDCTGDVCDFEVDKAANIRANVNSAPANYNLKVVAKGVRVTGKGIACPGDCQVELPAGHTEKLTSRANRTGLKTVWKNCGKVTANVCSVIMNENKTITASAKQAATDRS